MYNRDMKIELKNVTKTYDPDTKGIEDVTLTAEGMLGVVGEAGAGLHTLAGVIGGVLDTDSGELLFGGKVMNDVPPEKRNAFYSDRMTPPLKGSVMRNLTYGVRLRGAGRCEAEEAALAAAEHCGIEKLLTKGARSLPYGMRLRAELARMEVRRADVALFYDPFFGAEDIAEASELIKSAAERTGCTVIAFSPRGSELKYLGDECAVMRNGNVIRSGRTADVLSDPKTAYVACFTSDVPVNIVHDGGKTYAVRADDARLTAGDIPVISSGLGYTALHAGEDEPPFVVKGETSERTAGYVTERRMLLCDERGDGETSEGEAE